MDEAARREELRQKSRSAYVASAVTIAGGTATKLGPTIAPGKTRYIWRMVLGDVAIAAPDRLGVYSCAAAGAAQTVRHGIVPVGTVAVTGSGPTVIGDDPLAPLFSIPCITDTTNGDDVGVAHGTAAVDVTIDYYDE